MVKDDMTTSESKVFRPARVTKVEGDIEGENTVLLPKGEKEEMKGKERKYGGSKSREWANRKQKYWERGAAGGGCISVTGSLWP